MSFHTRPSYHTPSGVPGRNAHLYRLPQSPAPTLPTPNFASATDYFSSAGSRKRSRPDSAYSADTGETLGQTPGWLQCPTPDDRGYGSGSASAQGQDSTMVNERYTLAGGFDTPDLQATADMEQRDWRSEKNGRGRRGDGETVEFSHGARPQLPGPLARERNGVARIPSSPNGEAQASWTGLAFSIVGKVFTFGTSVVKGFYAGGGTGYNLKHSPIRGVLMSQEPCATPLPGAWHDDEFLGDFEQDNPQVPAAGSATRPPSKRRQTDKDSWVMVGTPSDVEQSPRRKASSKALSCSHNLSDRPTASRASSRRSLAPLPRRQSSYIAYSTGSPVLVPAAPHERRASIAPTRVHSRPSSSSSNPGGARAVKAAGGNAHTSGNASLAYVSPEAGKLLRRREKQDRRADAAIGDMSRKLAELIRQGQQALGTKVSVEGVGDDGEEVEEGW
ncbi:hypothetical protein B0A54_16424 [Friedmanniomyces endolithicus]|uniref:Uncharacterized protein n=1 Tax=Friedmanniomyces endolithicus TaxID=329885 RepID=A0A4V5N4P7_9PEZI|nr:hypothetical protein LTS09_015928 [Friedmanniomyces endolithicus]TKA28049.1 hypothetical protein B0A54_16424 [Friedmanniomyces endolithicus]